MIIATEAVLTATSVLLFGFGLNLLYLTLRATRLRPRLRTSATPRRDALVCVQLPIYNEQYVAQRVLDAACAIEWPRDRFEVQVLDDSNDETVGIVGARVAYWRSRGIAVDHVRRGSRAGFKAGALAYGLQSTSAEFIAIFDADFVPTPDFLERTINCFDDPSVAFVQARWGHLDEGYSWFTRLQALFIDFHFLVEQAVRSAAGYFVNFTGSAGVWRRTAIDDAGGWTAQTLTEDLDLSYRAQLLGWRAELVEDLVVPEELPVSIDAYRHQQSRWATGSFQCAFRLLGPVWRSRFRAALKLQATIHLLAYSVGPLMVVQLLCYPVLLATAGRQHIPQWLGAALLLGVCVAVSPWIGFMVAQTRRGRRWWTALPSLFCQVIGAGMSVNVILSLFAATRSGGTFVRTPKHHILRRGQEWRDQAYVRVGDPRALLEAGFGIGAVAILPFAVRMDQWLMAVYTALFALGFLTVASLSLKDFLEVVALRRLGERALRLIRAVAPAAAVVGVAGALLMLAARMPEPFEDGYGHWLIAANLATTGNLHDPLFGMEDTWLPGYHVLAAAVLHVFGVWQLGALKLMSAILAAGTAACVYALAPNARQARIATALLVLNPVFLFTSGSAVVEPLVTTLITGAGLAAVKGRMKVASLLAAMAVITSTKAWIWVAAAAGFAAFELIRTRTPLRSRAMVAWAIPAVGLLVFLQLGFAPATHSMARGTLEVVSASTRGSVATTGLGRLIELGSTFGLAALPLFALAPFGILAARRTRQSSAWKFVYGPALVYLAAVFALVAAGVYTGSHRYLYPALPALALLAATALDRHAKAASLLAVGATGLLAVGLLPVFWSFGNLNAGLIAAGRATAARPGVLVTDSPVVAYYSRRAPANIQGSQSLPANRDDAIAWMQEHGVTAVVLEDISYYRASTLFPDLATGNAAPPFMAIGDQKSYQVSSGGKAVYAYRLWPQLSLRDAAEGKTAPLAKGMTMSGGTGEGMGFGVPIVRYADGWVYSRTAATIQLSPTSWTRTFELDEIGGDAAHSYAFVPISSRGEIRVTYALDSSGVAITVNTLWLTPGYSEVGVLNEQSAAFDDLAAAGAPTRLGSAFGSWVPISGRWARLRSASLDVEWSVAQIKGATLYAGREQVAPDFDWAGLDYMFTGPFSGTVYRINVQEAR